MRLEVHPRMCGVLKFSTALWVSPEGSSPHVRGFEMAIKSRRCWSRFIPACAGFWFGYLLRTKGNWVHPRMCGVLRSSVPATQWEVGSSPHVRGFVPQTHRTRSSSRFIPACAGFCVGYCAESTLMWVHPRMCGVLVQGRRPRRPDGGSSPHVRGFAVTMRAKGDKNGFIPACAGFW